MGDGATQEPGLEEDLVRLATAYGVATEYWDWQGNHVTVPRSTVVAVLAALQVDAATDEAVTAALTDTELRGWRRSVPPVTVVRERGEATVATHVPDGWSAELTVWLEDGGRRHLEQVPSSTAPREVDGERLGEAVFALPTDLPLGWHELHLRSEDPAGDRGARESAGALVVSPDRLRLPAALAEHRQWGFMTMLFQVRSEDSWAFGDLADLAEVASWSAREHGAGFMLLNPLHATDPVAPVEASPYLPATRRFVNPLYLRVEDVRETAYLSAADRAVVEWHAEELRELNRDDVLIDRDLVWEAKKRRARAGVRGPSLTGARGGLRGLQGPRGPGPRGLVDLVRVARVLRHRLAALARARLGSPGTEAVAQLREELADRVELPLLAAVADGHPAGGRAARGDRGRAWGWASSTTSPSGCTRTARTPGRCRTRWPAG